MNVNWPAFFQDTGMRELTRSTSIEVNGED